jgi:hypothetical protein
MRASLRRVHRAPCRRSAECLESASNADRPNLTTMTFEAQKGSAGKNHDLATTYATAAADIPTDDPSYAAWLRKRKASWTPTTSPLPRPTRSPATPDRKALHRLVLLITAARTCGRCLRTYCSGSTVPHRTLNAPGAGLYAAIGCFVMASSSLS